MPVYVLTTECRRFSKIGFSESLKGLAGRFYYARAMNRLKIQQFVVFPNAGLGVEYMAQHFVWERLEKDDEDLVAIRAGCQRVDGAFLIRGEFFFVDPSVSVDCVFKAIQFFEKNPLLNW